MPYSAHIITMRDIKEDIPAEWRMIGTVICYDGDKYIIWRVHLEPSPYQQQFADISCAEEWEQAMNRCKDLFELPHPPRGLTGRHRTVEGCARGFVSMRCGGNAV